MAKKKTVETVADETILNQVEDNALATEQTNEVAEKQPEVKKDNDSEASKEIPANVDRILRVFKNLPEMYVSPAGGVFSADAKPSLHGGAILYKNPYYKS